MKKAEIKIIQTLINNDLKLYTDLTKFTGLTYKTVYYKINEFEQKGYIKNFKVTKKGFWYLDYLLTLQEVWTKLKPFRKRLGLKGNVIRFPELYNGQGN